MITALGTNIYRFNKRLNRTRKFLCIKRITVKYKVQLPIVCAMKACDVSGKGRSFVTSQKSTELHCTRLPKGRYWEHSNKPSNFTKDAC